MKRASYSSPQTFSSSRLTLLTVAAAAAAAFFVFDHSMQPWHWMLFIGTTSSVAAFWLDQILSSSFKKMWRPKCSTLETSVGLVGLLGFSEAPSPFGLDKASATKLLLPSRYLISVVYSAISESWFVCRAVGASVFLEIDGIKL